MHDLLGIGPGGRSAQINVAEDSGPKVAELVGSVLHEEVDRLEVTVDNGGTLRVKIGHGIADLPKGDNE